ncbi:MAG: hypothetical protein QM498_03925 [Desulfobacterium sp.]
MPPLPDFIKFNGLLVVGFGVPSIIATIGTQFFWRGPTQGEGYMLLVFAAVFVGGTSVFGGKGTIYGTLIGAVIIGMIEAGIISCGLSGLWTRMVYGIVIMVSVSSHAALTKYSKGST